MEDIEFNTVEFFHGDMLQHEARLKRSEKMPGVRFISVSGIPLESERLDKLIVVGADGLKKSLAGFVVLPGETMVEALTRTAIEMNATIIFEPASTNAPD